MTSFVNEPLPESQPQSPPRAAVLDWFRELTNDPGARARLRRCRSTLDAVLEPKAIHLARRLGTLSRQARADDDAIADALNLARVLAHVKTHTGALRPMQAAGWKHFPGDRREGDVGEAAPLLSEVRFRRLLTTGTGEPLVAAFIRLIRQLGGEVNIRQLSRDFRFWSHPAFGPAIRQQWAFDYYAATQSAPQNIDISTDEEDDR